MAKPKAPSGQTAIVSVRLNPKLRYLADLAARRHRRSMSNYIEWAVAESLQDVVLRGNPEDARHDSTIADQSNYLWDVHEADRFVKLACDYPELLTHEEHVLWCVVRSNRFLWRRCEGADEISARTNYLPPDRYFIYERLREHWDEFKAVARGEAELSSLPGMSSGDLEPEP